MDVFTYIYTSVLRVFSLILKHVCYCLFLLRMHLGLLNILKGR